MEPSIESILGREYQGRIGRSLPSLRRFPLRRWFRAFRAWWADDSMYARFERQRTHDEQLLHRYG